jgi:hypothetical protein
LDAFGSAENDCHYFFPFALCPTSEISITNCIDEILFGNKKSLNKLKLFYASCGALVKDNKNKSKIV